MVPSRVAGGGLTQQSSSSSGIFFQGDGKQSQAVANSHLSSSFANSPALNSVANSGPSSLVTDANSAALSGGPHLQRSASINNESYLCLPASPMSFSSNNISMDGGSSVVQQSSQSHHEQNHHHHNNIQQGGTVSTAMSLPQAASLQIGPRGSGSYLQDPVQKKPRVEVKQEDIMQQQVLQQILQRQDSMNFQNRNPQLHAILQQQRLRQQQVMQSIPQMRAAHIQQQQQHQQQQVQQQQMQLRQQMQQQQAMQPGLAMKRSYDGAVCARRLMQYLYHQRQRPPENTIAYWRKFVTEYYSPRAKKRWCLSLYENVGHHALGVFPQAAMDAWQCDLCGSKSGRGFEATSEVLPRLNEIKFGSGVIDELLFLDMPRESRFTSGIMMLEYSKAVQESVYEQLRVVREGRLRIIFSQDLKILSWEFCARRHEELLPRRVVAPQVNQLVQVAQKFQTTIAESGSDGVSQQDLQTNSNMVLSAGRQLAKSLELQSQSLNDLGFSKRYVRCLQISEVVNSMKDLIDFCGEQKAGPVDGLKNYPRHSSASAKLQMQQKMHEMEQLANAQGMPTDRNTLNKLMALHPGMNNQMGNNSVNINNNNHQVANRGALSGSAQTALALTNYQNLHMRQNSMNSNPNSLQQQEASSSFNNSGQSPSSSFPGTAAASLIPGSMQHVPVSGYSSPRLPSPSPPPPQPLPSQQQRSLMNANSCPGNQALQHQMIQQLLQEISSGSGGGMQQPSLSGGSNGNSNGGVPRNGMYFGGNSGPMPLAATPCSNGPPAPSRSNSFKGPSNSDSSVAVSGNNNSNNGFHQRAPDLPSSLHLQDDLIQDIAQEFTENGFFSSDLNDSAGYSWKG